MPLDLLPHCAEANTENSRLLAKKGNAEHIVSYIQHQNQALTDSHPVRSSGRELEGVQLLLEQL